MTTPDHTRLTPEVNGRTVADLETIRAEMILNRPFRNRHDDNVSLLRDSLSSVGSREKSLVTALINALEGLKSYQDEMELIFLAHDQQRARADTAERQLAQRRDTTDLTGPAPLPRRPPEDLT